MKKKTSPAILMKTMSKLVNEYTWAEIREALDVCEAHKAPKKKAGQPKKFDIDQLMQLWLYVEEGIAHPRRTVSAFCRNKKTGFQWISIGKTGIQAEKPITGKNLERRYHEAKAFLAKEAAPYRALAKGTLGIKMSGIDSLSPRERYLQKELEKRLSRKVVR